MFISRYVIRYPRAAQ